jgi:hypothetical protein
MSKESTSMMKNVLLCFSTIALASAFAASTYKVTLFDASTVNGMTLKPGDYKMELTGSGIVLKNGKDATEIPAKTEIGDKKFSSTKIRYNDKHEIQEICIGGTKTTVVLNSGTQSAGANGKHAVRTFNK